MTDRTATALRIADLTIVIENLDALCLQHTGLNDRIGQEAEIDLSAAIDERRRLLETYRGMKP
jgi:hypothetical protein